MLNFPKSIKLSILISSSNLITKHGWVERSYANCYLKLALSGILALPVVGCGGSSSSDDDTGDTEQENSEVMDSNDNMGEMEENTTGTGDTTEDNFPVFQGSFTVRESYSPNFDSIVRSMSLGASFFESDTRLVLGHQFLLGEDRCQELFSGSSVLNESINAGDVLVLSNANGTLFQLEPSGEEPFINYSDRLDQATIEQTTVMTLDIPGNQYAGLPTLPVPELDEVSGILPAIGSEITAQTEIRWTPSVHPDTIFRLNLNAFVDAFNVSIGCSLEDDGAFTLPEFFQGLIGDTSTPNWSVSRSRYVDHFENGAYLEIGRTVSAAP